MKRHTSPRSSRFLRSQLALGAPLVLLSAGAIPACADAQPRDLGFTQSAQDLSIEPTEPFFSDIREFAGRWVGSAEDTLALDGDGPAGAFRFPSGSSRILLELQVDAEGSVSGTLTFGEGAPLAAATDPDAGYPVGVSYDELLGYEFREQLEDGSALAFFVPTSVTIPPFEGFPYRVTPLSTLGINEGQTQVADGILSLNFGSYEPLNDWCTQQSAHPAENLTGFSCVPTFGGPFESGSFGDDRLCSIYGPPVIDGCLEDLSNLDECYQEGEVMAQVSCDKLTMCMGGFCTCYEDGCLASSTDERLTVRRVGDELVGLIEKANFKNARGLSVPVGEVRFTRE